MIRRTEVIKPDLSGGVLEDQRGAESMEGALQRTEDAVALHVVDRLILADRGLFLDALPLLRISESHRIDADPAE